MAGAGAGYSAESSADQTYGATTFKTDYGGQNITVTPRPAKVQAAFTFDWGSVAAGLVVAGIIWLVSSLARRK